MLQRCHRTLCYLLAVPLLASASKKHRQRGVCIFTSEEPTPIGFGCVHVQVTLSTSLISFRAGFGRVICQTARQHFTGLPEKCTLSRLQRVRELEGCHHIKGTQQAFTKLRGTARACSHCMKDKPVTCLPTSSASAEAFQCAFCYSIVESREGSRKTG